VQVEDDTDTTFGLVSGQRLGQGAVAATTGFRPPDAHFAGVYSSGTGTLPLGSSLRNVITGSAAVAADTLTLQAGSYYVEAFASLEVVDGLGSVQGASVALSGCDRFGRARHRQLHAEQSTVQRRPGVDAILSDGCGSHRLPPRLPAQNSTSQAMLAVIHAQRGTTRYDHELRIWQIG
jgi:hypothetical protein